MSYYKKFEQYNNDLILEYYNQHDTALYKYLKMNDRDKHIDIAFKLAYHLEDILRYIDIDEDISDEKDKEILHSFVNGESDLESYDFIEKLNDDTLDIIGKTILENHYELNLTDYMPSWFFFEDVELIKKQWLIHCTDFGSSLGIAKKGFIKGTYEIDELGLTTNVSKKSSYGYDFAYTVYDFDKYADRTYRSVNKFRYGNELILFRSSGVRAYHNGDSEYQTIFWGRNASDILMVYVNEENGKYYIASNINHAKLVEFEDASDLVRWLDKNYEQYVKHISSRSLINKENKLE